MAHMIGWLGLACVLILVILQWCGVNINMDPLVVPFAIGCYLLLWSAPTGWPWRRTPG